MEVTGVFQAVDAKHENLVIADLDSGIGVVPVALVRWSDVLSMTTVPPAETNGNVHVNATMVDLEPYP